MMKIGLTFIGGLATTDDLTGSCVALEVRNGKHLTTILIDAGLFQGNYKTLFADNLRVLDRVNPKNVDFIVLTHAHIDHCGLIPFLINHGFKGKIVCTEATAELLPIMFDDSHKVQKELAIREARRQQNPRNRKKQRIPQLFSYADVAKAKDLIWRNGFGYREEINLTNRITLKFYPSGHILGGAICIITISNTKSRTKKFLRLGFSGDLGRQENLLLPPPATVSESVDIWLTESTYGNKRHPQRQSELARLYALINSAFQAKKRIIIPSFSLQRSQELIYLLTLSMQQGLVPTIPIYLDSPMARKITDVFSKNWEAKPAYYQNNQLDFNPFNEENRILRFINDEEESMRLITSEGPYIVIASSGMCDAGRIREHLRHNLSNADTIVCLVGFMVDGSLGKKLKKGLTTLQMNDQKIEVRASIQSFDSFSAHADTEELVVYAQAVMAKQAGDFPRSIYILHGDRDAGLSLQEKLANAFQGKVDILLPLPGEQKSIKLE